MLKFLKKELKKGNIPPGLQGQFCILKATGQFPAQILVQTGGQNIRRKGRCKAPNLQFCPIGQFMYLLGHPQKYKART